MWNVIIDRIPSFPIILLAALTAVIPWGINKLNRTLHDRADPPWKRKG